MENNGLWFDEATHTYGIGQVRLASVTDIIKRGGLMKGEEYFTDFARERGTAVHHGINLHIQNRLDTDNLHPVIRPYLQGFFRFMIETGFRPMLHFCERPMHNGDYWYAGKPDLVGILNSRIAIIDAKTGESDTARYQLAAYKKFDELMRLFGMNIDTFDLRLDSTGTYRLKAHSDPNDWLIFLKTFSQLREEGKEITGRIR